jgi:hypothetical protein
VQWAEEQASELDAPRGIFGKKGLQNIRQFRAAGDSDNPLQNCEKS